LPATRERTGRHNVAGAFRKVCEANREVIKDANLIFPGQKIRIPKA